MEERWRSPVDSWEFLFEEDSLDCLLVRIVQRELSECQALHRAVAMKYNPSLRFQEVRT
jgi:hypothetical protein